MKKRHMLAGIVSLLLILVCSVSFALEASYQFTGLIRYDKRKAFKGYTLVTSNTEKKVYLIDMEGMMVHKWSLETRPGLYAELLPNGNLLVGGRPQGAPVSFSGTGGYVAEYTWDGKRVWKWKEMGSDYAQHHCFDRMPNGNTLVLGWEYKSYDEAIAKGRDPKTLTKKGYDNHGKMIKGIWPDYLREVTQDGKVAWEWHVWDHVGTGEHQWDINHTLPQTAGYYGGPDWTHLNSVEYLPETDQILLCSRNFGEIYLIDHKTGKMVFRWGNPSAYGKGKAPSWIDDGDQKLWGPHHATLQEGGNILIFDNGYFRPSGERSRVMEVNPKSGEIEWQWEANMNQTFYSRFQGAVQKLPNGNYFITSSNTGHLMEITGGRRPKIVWEWINPMVKGKAQCLLDDQRDHIVKDHQLMGNYVHRAFRYAADHPAFKGKKLGKGKPFKNGCPETWKLYDKNKGK